MHFMLSSLVRLLGNLELSQRIYVKMSPPPFLAAAVTLLTMWSTVLFDQKYHWNVRNVFTSSIDQGIFLRHTDRYNQHGVGYNIYRYNIYRYNQHGVITVKCVMHACFLINVLSITRLDIQFCFINTINILWYNCFQPNPFSDFAQLQPL